MSRIACPSCLKPGDVPDAFLGKRVKCRQCGHRFEAVAPQIPLVGRTDLENISGLSDESKAMIERSIRAGTCTGFRQFRPGEK